jgi:hypothetical protein
VRTTLKHHAAALAAVALGVLVFGTGVANAHGDRGNVLKLGATELQSDFIDVGDPGPSLGDEIVFSETVFKRGRDVGMSGGVCTITYGVPPYTVVTAQCVVTLKLRQGQITLQGLNEFQGMDDPGPFTLAITGGTGEFRGAGGEATFRMVSDERGVYKLRLDSGKKKNHHSRGHHRR